MADSVHIRRFVRPESIPSLGFREDALKEFGRLGIEVVADHNLHSTIIHDPDFRGSLEDIAAAMRTQPDSADKNITVNVVGGDEFGRSYLTGTSWFALALDSDALDSDYEHYKQLLTDPGRRVFHPHIALFKTTRPTSSQQAEEINDWIQEQAPRDITLRPVGAGWSTRQDKQNNSSHTS